MGLCRYLESKKILDKQKHLAELPQAYLTVQGLPSYESVAKDIESEVHVGGCTIIHMYNEIEKILYTTEIKII